MLVKGRQAERFARQPSGETWAVLLFSEDDGLVAETAQAALSAWAGKAPLDVTLLDDDAIRKEPALLHDALEAASLLGDARAVRVRTSGDKIASLLAEVIAAGDAAPDRFAARLVIEAGSLPAKSKLRSAAEGARRTAALQLFAEDGEALGARVRDALMAEGMLIEDAALALFLADLPGNRAIANAEIEKLVLYARGLGRPLAASDIEALTAAGTRQDMSAVIAAALDGQAAAAHTALDRLSEAGTSPISVLRALQMETQRMLAAQERIAGGDANPGKALRPPVWQSDWPAFRKRLDSWPAKRLVRILARIHDAERQAKTAGASAEPVVRMLINDLARTASGAR